MSTARAIVVRVCVCVCTVKHSNKSAVVTIVVRGNSAQNAYAICQKYVTVKIMIKKKTNNILIFRSFRIQLNYITSGR